MEIDPDEVPSMYRTLAGAVVPRPIAWVSTTGPDGTDNLAPYSFFNVVAVDPPVVMFAPVDKSDAPEGLKDTPRNVRRSEEFVVNVVTESVAEAMNETAATLPAGESEFDRAAVTRADSTVVAPPRVAESPVAFECSLYEMVDVGGSSMVLGEVERVHLDDDVTTDGKMDVEKLDAVGRLSGSLYATTEDRFTMERPP
ncbi:flavin reductase family protein [Halorussus sp. MSC15.2]|uniref:flavin reductase family protein n=1 Tax=Halorussus sp. MSC15.2 TaxID=2283638 RepID=UPI0013D50176|nr:flavin reductase family protein [Halorussus sp. MSC15.2]NEU57373.1 flavin reductase family protein [Halorussus sp. MSC15.2]